MMKLIFCCFVFLNMSSFLIRHNYERLNGPVVGILTLPTSRKDATFCRSSFSMIPGSYVKWLEQAGIRIIPIRYDMPKKMIVQLMGIINGILITGGSTSLFHENNKVCLVKRFLDKTVVCPSPYMRTADFIISQAVKLSEAGRPFPIWGTCLGYEAILMSLSKYSILRKRVKSINHSLNLDLNKTFQPLFTQYFGKQLLAEINDEPLIYFNHKYAFFPDQIQSNAALKDQIDILSTTTLESGENVISMIKHRKYPFIGVQFHPEKIQYEHRSSVQTNVSYQSLEAAHKMAMMFFDQVNKNENEFGNESKLEAMLIYNYPMYKSSGPYEQVYVFPKVYEMTIKNTNPQIKV